MEEEEAEVPEESFTSTKEFKVKNNCIQSNLVKLVTQVILC